MSDKEHYRRRTQRELKLGVVRHHVITIAAYLLAARHDGEPARQARIAVKLCIDELDIAPADIDRRHKMLNISEDES